VARIAARSGTAFGACFKTPLATLSIALSEHGCNATGELHSLVVLMERRIRHHLGRARAAALSGPTRAQTLITPRIDDVGNALGKIHADKRIALAQNVPRDLAVACEQQDFDGMAGNLLENAFRWARNKVEVHAHHDDGRSIAIVIEDDGSGLRPEQIPQVLRLGERMDESAPGFGFGLPITRELAELYGGDLNLDASGLGGLRGNASIARRSVSGR
jgi:signal transduction histidine kinase